jgi:hypothetical protein
MAAHGNLLFFSPDQGDLDSALRDKVNSLRRRVDALPHKTFVEKSDDEIAALVANEAAVQPLEVDFDSAQASVTETQVQTRPGFDAVLVPGLKATKTVPFKGDRDLWSRRPNPWDMNPPRGDVHHDVLVVGISVPAQQADEAARHIKETLDRIPAYLQWQREQIERHNAGLTAQATQWIKMRRERLNRASDLLKQLGG